MRAVLQVFACLAVAFSLSGCAVYEVASTAVDVTTTVVGTTVDVVGVVIPSGHDDSDKKAKSN